MGWQSKAYAGMLAPDDIAGIQAIYGARSPDIYDAAAANNQISTATDLPVGEHGSLIISADLTSHADVDYYQFTMPANRNQLTVSVDARQISLLAPAVSIYDAQGRLVAETAAEYGGVATARVADLTPGATYFVAADGATSDEFGMGAYELEVQFSGSAPVVQTPEINTIPPEPTTMDVGIDADTNTDEIAEKDPEQLIAPPVAVVAVDLPDTDRAVNVTNAVHDNTNQAGAGAASESDVSIPRRLSRRAFLTTTPERTTAKRVTSGYFEPTHSVVTIAAQLPAANEIAEVKPSSTKAAPVNSRPLPSGPLADSPLANSESPQPVVVPQSTAHVERRAVKAEFETKLTAQGTTKDHPAFATNQAAVPTVFARLERFSRWLTRFRRNESV